MLENAAKDFLTGFYSREALSPFLTKLMSDGIIDQKRFSLALVDLDRFKKFNDKYGHLFGDEVLKYTAGTMRLTFHENPSFLFRFGGDEFIGVFPDKSPPETLHLLRKCNYNLYHRPFLFKGKFYRISLSCGVAGFPADAKDAKDLIHRADKAMYTAKRYGRSLVALAGKKNYSMRLRHLFARLKTILIAILIAFMFYHFALGKLSKLVGSAARYTMPGNLDEIMLVDGRVYQGYILEETRDRLVLDLYLSTVLFNKSEIAKIKYHQENLNPGRILRP
ncbi:MAG: GGDEF domain-containing protein [Candidatus Omnitrophota bacterium]|nr:MAG: GGDEF domain-containing protein [Candidatus Omnitrophota bacterium]